MPFFVTFLLLTCASIATGNNVLGDDFLHLDQDVLQDISDIYNSIPLTLTKLQNVTVMRNKINFYLFSHGSTQDYTMIDFSNASAVDKAAPILFLIHGWTQNRTTDWYQLYTEIFFGLNSQYNIIQVDYAPYSKLGYVTASYIVKDIGYIVGEFIATLIQDYSIRITNILLIGHSLGGHVASFAAKKVQELLNEKLPRIISPDPAGPLFENRPVNERLNENDAAVVEVIHSNGGVFGMLTSCGSVDFFLNGGSNQPGCAKDSLLDLKDNSNIVMCNHHRSWKVFASAIQHPDKFIARKFFSCPTNSDSSDSCSSNYVNLGDLTTDETGNYYLNTTDTSPYF